MNRVYNKPDLNKPRYKRDTLRLLNQAFFSKFREKYPNSTLTNKQLKSIIVTFHQKCIKQVVDTRDGLDLYNGLGFIFVGACKIKDKHTDHKLSGELETLIHTKDWDTNQWICKVCYTNYAQKYRFKNASFWGFEPSRTLSRATSEAFKNNHKLYVITDNFKKFNRLFKRLNHKFWENNKETVIQHHREIREELKNKEED